MAAAPPATIRPRRLALSASPTAATNTRTLSTGWFREETSLRLMRQLYLQIPIMRRAISILAGMVGVPELTGEDDAHTEALEAWARDVRVGWNGRGLRSWLTDHVGQTLWYGYGVAEAEAEPDASDVFRLWSYRSPNFRFQAWDKETLELFGGGSYAAGLNLKAPPEAATRPTLQVIQRNALGGEVPLNPFTSAVSTYDPEGSDPRGQMLFLSCPTVAQVWTTTLQAHGAMQRRMGIPIYVVSWNPPATFEDIRVPDTGKYESQVFLEEVEAKIAEMVKGQVERGVARDLALYGDVKVSILGADGHSQDFQVSKRQLLEEIVVASGIPPFLLGYSWSSTERMSQVQERALVNTVDQIRAAVEPAVRAFVDLQQLLAGETRPYELEWPDVGIREMVDSARAALMDAQAEITKLDYATGLWREGVWNQEKVAEYCTGSPDVATPMDEPSAPVAAPPPLVKPGAGAGGAVETGAAGGGTAAMSRAGARWRAARAAFLGDQHGP